MKSLFFPFLCILLFTCLSVSKLDAQIVWQDNFDNYTTDSIIDPQSSDWVGWGQVITSAMVSSDTSSSGANCLKIWDGTALGSQSTLSDLVRLLGNYTTGRYVLEFKVLVPSTGSSGTYWNIQHAINSSYTGTQWAMEIYLRPKGQTASTITAGGVTTNIPTVYDKWVNVRHVFDMDLDSAEFYYDGKFIERHKFSLLSNTNNTGLNQLAGIDLFAACGASGCNELAYFDDFVFKEYGPYATNDAGVVAIDSPSVFCAGSHDVIARINNYGVNQIDTLDVNWEVNGVAQPTISIYDTLGVFKGLYPTDTMLNLGSATFNKGSNTIKVYTSNPNNETDTVNFNDTLLIIVNTAMEPSVVRRFNPTTSSIDIDVNNIANQVDYEYGLTGFNRGSGTNGSNTSFPFTISGLTQSTGYDLYVRNNCGSGDTSAWIGPFEFSTSYTLPFKQDFESFSPGNYQNPWLDGWASNASNENIIRWESEIATGSNVNTINTGPVYDHTNFGTSGGRYVYFEAAFSYLADSANFISPPIEIPIRNSAVEISYWYFNYGSEIDRLVFSVDTNGVSNVLKTYYGPQQNSQSDEWIKESIYLTGYEGHSIQLKYTGYKALGYYDNADMAIDDIRVDTVPDINASIIDLVEPSGALCAGTINPIVAVQNRGVDDLTSVDIVLDINGVLDTSSFTFGTVITGDTVHLTLSSATFSSGTLYDISVYSINPNNGTDQNPSDDTLSLSGLRTGLAGSFTLDPSQPISTTNFTSFNDLSNTVNSVGICGAVTVTVAAGTYTDNIRFINVPGTSPADRLIIDGVSADSVSLRKGSNAANASVVFEGASFITLKNMTIENVFTGTQWGIHFSNNSSYDSIVDCRIIMNSNGSGNIIGVGATGNITNAYEFGNNASYITVKDCHISGGGAGVRFYGAQAGIWTNTNNHFIGNTIESANNYGMYLYTQDSLLVENNKIFDFRNQYSYGIMAYYTMNFDIKQNEILSSYYGLYMFYANSSKDPDKEATIVNNITTSFGQNNGRAMYIFNPVRLNVYHNSVLGKGSNPAADFSGSFIDSLDVRNNVFACKGSGVAFRMNGAIDTTVFLKFDNNVYYAPTSSNLIDINNSTFYSSLSDYQSARLGYNANSIEGDPSFKSDTNLRIAGTLINDSGDNGVNVLTDIDGDVRPYVFSTFVDPGADEYDPPACPSPIELKGFVIDFDSMLISWESGIYGSDVEVNWTFQGNPRGTGNTNSTTSDTIHIGNLLANTSYDVYIREICRRGDTSLWVGPISLQTPCESLIATYTMNFDNQTIRQVPACWTEYNKNSQYAYARVYNYYSYSPNNALLFYNYANATGNDSLIAFSPKFTDMPNGNNQIRFQAWTNDTLNYIVVATADRADEFATFNPIDTIQLSVTQSWVAQSIEISLANGYNGTDEYLVFSHSISSSYRYFAIDNFVYEPFLTCLPPINLTSLNIDSTSASLSWDVLDTANQWEVQYGPKGFNIGSGTTTTSNIDTVLLSGLNVATNYDVYVRAVCDPLNKTAWSKVYTFATDCPIRPITLPFNENWENINGTLIGSGIIACDTSHSWVFNTNESKGRLRYGTNAAATSQGSGAATMDISSGTQLTKNSLILTLDLTNYNGSNDLELSFDLRDHNDEAQAGDNIWIRGNETDSWVQVFNVASNASSTFTRFTVDVDAALANASPVQLASASFQIRFGQEDDSPFPDDGVSFDSIRVTGTPNSVGLPVNQLKYEINVYPNPSNGYFNLNINTENRENFNLVIRDVKGQLVYTKHVSVKGEFRDQLDLNGWSRGVYYMQIQSKGGTKVKKLIVQ